MNKYLDRNWLFQKYCIERKMIDEIANICGVKAFKIIRQCRRFNLKKLTERDYCIFKNNKELLYKEYITNKLSMRKIGKKYDINHMIISFYLNFYNIKIRNKNEELVISRSERSLTRRLKQRNKKDSNGFLKPIFNYNDKDWRALIFRRDNFTCQFCKQHGGHLNAHHIVKKTHLIKIIKFENLDLDLSRNEHKILLEEKFKNDDRTKDISNGITLCIKCHQNFHTKWKQKLLNLSFIDKININKILEKNIFLGNNIEIKFEKDFKTCFNQETFKLYCSFPEEKIKNSHIQAITIPIGNNTRLAYIPEKI